MPPLRHADYWQLRLELHVCSCGIRFSKDYQLRVPYTCPTARLYKEPIRQLFYLYALIDFPLYRFKFLVANCSRFEINQTLARSAPT
jgi:hypothetical protein